MDWEQKFKSLTALDELKGKMDKRKQELAWAFVISRERVSPLLPQSAPDVIYFGLIMKTPLNLNCLHVYVLYDNFPDIWGQDLQQMQKSLQQEESRIPKFKQKVEEAKVRNSLKSNTQ